MSINLYLLNKKGYQVLLNLIRNSERVKFINLVIGAKDKGNREDYYDEIKKLCLENSISFSDRKNDVVIYSNYSIAIGWRWLIKDVPNLIVLHDSMLPKYRGFSPLTNMLINGEDHLGVSAIWASDGMDEGDIIAQKKISITYPIKIERAIDQVSKLYEEVANIVFEKIIDEKPIVSIPQNKQDASYSIWRDENDYFINWDDSAENIKRFIDAVGYPYDGAKAKTATGEIFKIIECSVVGDIRSEIIAPGKLLMIQNNMPIILCGLGNKAIRLEEFENLDGSPFKFSKFRTRLL